MKNGFGGLGGLAGMQGILEKAKAMQDDLNKKNKELATKEFAGSSKGGLVEVRANGKMEVLDVSIKEDFFIKNDKKQLEDMIKLAINDVNSKILKEKKKSLGSLGKAFNI